MTFKQYNHIKPDVSTTHYRKTGNDCPVCEEGELLQADHERFCNTCYVVIDEATFPNNNRSLWVRWWDYRESEYSGFKGKERVKMAGGFTRPYFVGEDSLEEDEILL